MPSAAIALQMKAGAVNPPAAAAAAIFASEPMAQRQPLYGAFYLVAPALVGTVWSLLVQYATARAVKAAKAWRSPGAAPVPSAPDRTVKVSVVDPAVSTIIVQAIEGAAYVDDPLTYLIETLTADQRRLDLTKTILSKLRMLNPRHRKASQLQRIYRAHRARRILAQVAAPSTAAAMV